MSDTSLVDDGKSEGIDRFTCEVARGRSRTPTNTQDLSNRFSSLSAGEAKAFGPSPVSPANLSAASRPGCRGWQTRQVYCASRTAQRCLAHGGVLVC